MRLTAFYRSETGAVTTDWVVMTTAVLGLGVAGMSVISLGTNDATDDIDAFLANTDVHASAAFVPFGPVVLAAFDFAEGAATGWMGGWPTDVGGELGEVLQIGANEIASLAFNVPSGASTATLTFDLIGMDSIDREPATISINGSPVLVARGDFGQISFSDESGGAVGIEMTEVARGAELGGNTNDGWTESVTTVTLTVDNPTDAMTLSVHSATNQSRSDESYALDNVAIAAS